LHCFHLLHCFKSRVAASVRVARCRGVLPRDEGWRSDSTKISRSQESRFPVDHNGGRPKGKPVTDHKLSGAFWSFSSRSRANSAWSRRMSVRS
jgi:hypothetical protein